MRKTPLLASLALGILVLAPIASAEASPNHGQATGTGALGQFGDPTVHVNAIQTPAGLKGGFTIRYPDGSFARGTATCVVEIGDTAYVTGQITASSGPRESDNRWAEGNYLVIGIQDNGEPGTDGPDRLNFSPGFTADPGCGPNGAATPVYPIVAGNFQVSDGSDA